MQKRSILGQSTLCFLYFSVWYSLSLCPLVVINSKAVSINKHAVHFEFQGTEVYQENQVTMFIEPIHRIQSITFNTQNESIDFKQYFGLINMFS